MVKRACSATDATKEKPANVLAPIFSKKPRLSIPVDDGSKKDWKVICWNVAGLRACVKKNDFKKILEQKPDLLFMGETKCVEWPQEILDQFGGYKKTLVPSMKAGYAGVGLLSKVAPIKVSQGIGDAELDAEGRMVTAEFADYYFVGVYVPNSGRGLVNLQKRGRWEQLLLAKLTQLDAQKPVVYGGDLNVAHNEIDLRNPESNRNKSAGFTDEERSWFTNLLAAGFKDTFRELHPEAQKYTYWSYLSNSRSKDVGWRLDYYVVSQRIMEKVEHSGIMPEVGGSDHAPVVLKLKL